MKGVIRTTIISALIVWGFLYFFNPTESLVGMIGIIVLVLSGAFYGIDHLFWNIAKGGGGTLKLRVFWEKVKDDQVMWAKRLDFSVTTLLLLATLMFMENYILVFILSVVSFTCMSEYLGYIGEKYKDDLDDPDGFT